MFPIFTQPGRYLLTVALMVSLAFPGAGSADTLRIFAAASLKTALDQFVEQFETETGQEVRIAYGGSSSLARQISLGAPADIFISANANWMDYLQEKGLLVEGTRRDLFSNHLVIASHEREGKLASLDALASRLGGRRLAMAQTDAVPAGIYGKAALQAAGVWEDVKSQVVQTDNVRSALALISTGAAPFGVVYGSDVQIEPRVSVAFLIPSDLHPLIVYPIAALQSSPLADSFLTSIAAPSAQELFQSFGFPPPGGVDD